MKKLKVIILLIACSIQYAIAQNAHPKHQQSIISTKVVVLRYEGRTDTLFIPRVSKAYPQLQKALSYKEVLNEDLDSVIAYYKGCGCGTTGLSYDIPYESKDIISITVHGETMGAYPDYFDYWFTFDVHTGKPYDLTKEINTAGLKWITTRYKAMLKEQIADSQASDEEKDNDPFDQLKDALAKTTPKDILGKYVFTDKGITFSTYRVLPHVYSGLEPDRDWPVSYKTLRKYKKATAMVLTRN